MNMLQYEACCLNSPKGKKKVLEVYVPTKPAKSYHSYQCFFIDKSGVTIHNIMLYTCSYHSFYVDPSTK